VPTEEFAPGWCRPPPSNTPSVTFWEPFEESRPAWVVLILPFAAPAPRQFGTTVPALSLYEQNRQESRPGGRAFSHLGGCGEGTIKFSVTKSLETGEETQILRQEVRPEELVESPAARVRPLTLSSEPVYYGCVLDAVP
jgi:hypothetical protein